MNSTNADDSVTIVLDDTNESIQEVFQPVRAGGQKLDETVDLESSSEDEDEEEEAARPDEYDTHYTTTTGGDTLTTFQTPCASVNHTRTRLDWEEPILIRSEESFIKGIHAPAASNSTPTVAVQKDDDIVAMAPPAQKTFHAEEDDPFAIKDEFLEDSLAGGGAMEESARNNVTLPGGASFKSGPMVVQVTPASSQPAQVGSPELADSAICSANPSPVSDESESLKTKKSLSEQLPKTCTILESSRGGQLYLVGTAHFSEESQKDVVDTMKLVEPDAVLLELCKGRSPMLHYDEKYLMEQGSNMGSAEMMANIREHGTIQGTINFLMTSMAADLTKKLGMAPGGEFRVGFREAKKLPNCIVKLGDRPINVTLRRAVNSLSLWQKITFAFNLLMTNEDFTKEDIEKMKEKDMLEQLMEELAGNYPILTEVLVAERDIYLAYSLSMAIEEARLSRHVTLEGKSPVVVGIVGMGHVKGIQQHWEKVSKHDIARISVVPQTSLGERIVRTGFRLGFYSLLLYGGYRVLKGPASRIVDRFAKI